MEPERGHCPQVAVSASTDLDDCRGAPEDGPGHIHSSLPGQCNDPCVLGRARGGVLGAALAFASRALHLSMGQSGGLGSAFLQLGYSSVGPAFFPLCVNVYESVFHAQ